MRLFHTRLGSRQYVIAAAILLVAVSRALASDGSVGGGADEVSRVLLALIVALVGSKLGGEVFVRFGQPAVLGELVVGMVVGNLALIGVHGLEYIRHDEPIEILSEIGIILLLFQVGLESDLNKMIRVGTSSLIVATIGVIVPFLLGWIVAALFLPNESIYVHLFVGATLCATSVGITARVFRDLGKLQATEARIVLGAAVVDDVQGLVILAIVSGLIGAAGSGGAHLSTWGVLAIVAKAVAFLFGSIILGRYFVPRTLGLASRFRASDLLLTSALGIAFAFGYLAKLIGLAPIVGAFAAGLILDEVHCRDFSARGEKCIEDLIAPIVGFLAPVFFFHMGDKVDFSAFARPEVLTFAAALTLAAILGKQACGLGAVQQGLDRLSVGIGMIPRGEVGLIFAGIGAKLMIEGEPVVGASTFSAVVIMVVVTTMITPPLLKWSLSRRRFTARP